MKNPVEAATAALLSIPNSTPENLGTLVGIQQYLERNTLLSQAQLDFWIRELARIPNEIIQSSHQQSLFFELSRSLMKAIVLCSTEAPMTIPIAYNKPEAMCSGITPNLGASYLWNMVFGFLSLRERAGTATLSKKWRNWLEEYPLEGIMPLMRISDHRIGWIFLNVGIRKHTLRKWRQRLRELNIEEKENFQHIQIMAAAMPINDSAKFELNASENILHGMKNISFLRKMKIYILGFFIYLIGINVMPKKLLENPSLLNPVIPMMSILIITYFCLKTDGDEMSEKNRRAREYYSVIEDRHRLLATQPAQNLRARLHSFTVIHKIPHTLTETKKSQFSQHSQRQSPSKILKNPQDGSVSTAKIFGKEL